VEVLAEVFKKALSSLKEKPFARQSVRDQVTPLIKSICRNLIDVEIFITQDSDDLQKMDVWVLIKNQGGETLRPFFSYLSRVGKTTSSS